MPGVPRFMQYHHCIPAMDALLLHIITNLALAR